jgi:hypothetical protein
MTAHAECHRRSDPDAVIRTFVGLIAMLAARRRRSANGDAARP